jgi:hypothetical protein
LSLLTSHPFVPELLDSYSRFCAYFSDHQDLQKIKLGANQARVKKKLLGRWEICKLTALTPFTKIYALFSSTLEKIRTVFHFFSPTKQEENKKQDAELLFGKNRIAFSANILSDQSKDVYLQPPLPVNEIRSEKVKRCFNPLYNQLLFNRKSGCCRGMSEWFLYLYFNSQSFYLGRKSRDHVRTICSIFEKGATSPAVLLQALCHNNSEFLGLSAEQLGHLPVSPSTKINEEKIVNLFRKIAPGAYAINLPTHRLNYIAKSTDKGYLFDPDHGLTKIQSAQDFASMAKHIVDYSSSESPYLIGLERITHVKNEK